MFTGSAPGAGKSSLSRFLAEQLTLHGIETDWLYEEDVFTFEPIHRFAAQTFGGDLRAADSFLEGTRLAMDQWRDTDIVRITDSFLPGFYWLLHLYPKNKVEALMIDVWRLVKPLQPLLVYCQADVWAAHRRAVAQRGERWDEAVTRFVSGWITPQYPTRLKDLDDVLSFFSWLDERSLEILSGWPGEVLLLDTSHSSAEAAQALLLDHLGVQRLEPASPIPAPDLHEYAGRYDEISNPEDGEHVEVRISNGRLFATLYWPSGSTLVWQESDLFRLESTSRMVEFNRNEFGSICGLEYRFWNGSQQYSRRPKSGRV